MRYADRGTVKAPKSLVDASGAGALERTRAAKHYQVPGVGAFKFKSYKGADVIKALETLFHKKCAYCESLYGATQPADIEHYRPKLAVYGADGHPGYWWLAAEWSNLLPSCIDCNRRRYHKHYESDDGPISAAQAAKLAGKKDYFPIAGTWRASTPFHILKYEAALLIDPTRRKPEAHLTWGSVDAKGRKISVVRPRVNGKVKDPHGSATITVLGLNRSGLVDVRTAVMERLECDYIGLLDSIRTAAKVPPDELATCFPGLEKRIVAFMSQKSADKAYSACAGQFIDDMVTNLLGELEALKKKAALTGP